ncbi:MAG: Rpp14/Pop5 family protein [Candidatus Altiarchaeota archaeon]
MPKPVPPTLRERNRYLVFEAISDSQFDRKAVVNSLWNSMLRLYGEVGASETSIWIMDWDEGKSRGIVKVNHKAIDRARAAIGLVGDIGGKSVILRVITVSGTLKKARENL